MPVAFKEWQVVCDALASGRQAVLLRKGGIHEGREGFSFAHESFYLFPTKFHAQSEHVREGEFSPESEWQVGDMFSITHYAEALFAVTLTDWSHVEALFPYHIFTEQTLKDRFDWEGKGMSTGSIHLAFVKVSKLLEPLEIKYEKRFGGCRSWIEMPDTPVVSEIASFPVLGSRALDSLASEIRKISGVPQ